jgi:hypothetical protein
LKKLFTILCVLTVFFGIVGWPWPYVPATIAVTNTEVGSDSASPVPEPISLLLLGSGLVGLAVLGRKSFKK